jgi:hypothetical protein
MEAYGRKYSFSLDLRNFNPSDANAFALGANCLQIAVVAATFLISGVNDSKVIHLS